MRVLYLASYEGTLFRTGCPRSSGRARSVFLGFRLVVKLVLWGPKTKVSSGGVACGNSRPAFRGRDELSRGCAKSTDCLLHRLSGTCRAYRRIRTTGSTRGVCTVPDLSTTRLSTLYGAFCFVVSLERSQSTMDAGTHAVGGRDMSSARGSDSAPLRRCHYTRSAAALGQCCS
jgi:hypothetical protein